MAVDCFDWFEGDGGCGVFEVVLIYGERGTNTGDRC
jgi:hypothetical protein